MFSFFNADVSSPLGCPTSAMDIVISSLLFAFFGVMMFIASVRYELTYDKIATWWKWCFAPLAIAVLLGLQKVAFLTSIYYANTVITRKLLVSHYLALIIPLLCAGTIIFYRWKKQQQVAKRVY